MKKYIKRFRKMYKSVGDNALIRLSDVGEDVFKCGRRLFIRVYTRLVKGSHPICIKNGYMYARKSDVEKFIVDNFLSLQIEIDENVRRNLFWELLRFNRLDISKNVNGVKWNDLH